MKDINDVKQGVTDTFNKYFNDLRNDYNVDEADVHRLKMRLFKEIDNIILIEKKYKEDGN